MTITNDLANFAGSTNTTTIFANGWVKTVEQKNAEVLNSLTANTP